MACMCALELCVLNEGFLGRASVQHVVSTAGTCAGVWAAYTRSESIVWTTYAKVLDLAGLDDLLCRLFEMWPEMAEVVYRNSVARQTLPTTSRDMWFPCAASAHGKLGLVHAMKGYLSVTTTSQALSFSWGNPVEEVVAWMDVPALKVREDGALLAEYIIVTVLLNFQFDAEDDMRTICTHCRGMVNDELVVFMIGLFMERHELRYRGDSPHKNVALILEVFNIDARAHDRRYMCAVENAADASDIQTVRALLRHRRVHAGGA